MAVSLSPVGGAAGQFFDNNGDPLVGGRLFTYAAGTTTPQTTYTTSSGATANSNPIILNSGGRVPSEIWLTNGVQYKFSLFSSDNNLIGTWDNISGINSLGQTSADITFTGFKGQSGFVSDLADADGANWIGFQPVSPGIARSAQEKMRDIVSIKDFGAVGDGVADDTAAFLAARTFAASKSASGNVVKIEFPAGRYKYTTSPNWAIDRLHMEAQGEVWLIGSDGPGMLFDGGATGAGIYGLKIKGDFLVYAIGASSTHGVYMRAISKSDIELNVRGAAPTYSGLYMEWGVSNTIRLLAGVNEGGWYPAFTPARALTLTQRDTSEQSSYNVFVNCELSGCPVGAYLDAALGNSFFGGAIQANTTYGAQLTANAWANKFYGTDFEANTSNFDVTCDGFENQFFGCDFEDLVTFTSAAKNNAVFGGVTENLTIDSGAAQTRIIGLLYNRFNAGSLVDNGTRTRFRDIVNKATSVVSNTPLAKTTLSVTASPYTYANNTGGEQSVLISSGTVSQVVFVRNGVGETVSTATNMMLTLSPLDSVIVTYSSAPSMFSYTR